MGFLIKLVYCIAITSLATALPSTRNPPIYQTETVDTYDPRPHQEQATYEAFAIPADLTLPKSEPAPVPFYVPEINTDLRAPQYSEEPDYYAIPIPSQDLIAPLEQNWNPENDPKLFYEIPATITQDNTPTNLYPKKYNKDVHIKSKPYSSKPKQEIVLEPISEKQFLDKQKTFTKVYDSLAKKENEKELEKPLFQPKGDLQFAKTLETESVVPYGGFSSDAALTATFGASSPLAHSSSNGERHEFHMAGHDGPHSYKWGYDTGKGHNRQFRYEERDKEGLVKGHFGFYDKHGKLQMINYDAHPHEGYHAEGNFGRY